MIAHVYRHGDRDGQIHEATRITVLADGRNLFGISGPTLVIGTLPNTTAIAMADLEWFWIEEN